MLLTQNTYNEQAKLASYCRTGDTSLIGQVDSKRVGHYRRLVFNVVKDSLKSAFPLTRNLLSTDEWGTLVEEFFTNHTCQSKQIWKMPKELIDYMKEYNHHLLEKHHQLGELLWFEWLEIDLYMSDDIHVNYLLSGDLLKDKIVVNPEIKLERFNYPVHLKKATDIKKDEKGNYFLAIHRQPESGKVIFTNLSPAYVRLIELLYEQPENLDSLTYQIAEEFALNNTNNVKQSLLEFLESALKSNLVVGFQ